ncbi:anti-sigma factor [Azoarcus sp. KH32C]|uniref:anti-sigma factor family protein n=1 Tax=Azoarcus sp. KH32C TaxID=748247 RepID=UPI0002386D58|nr:anti-sigma factor [Azoarcus sp. KH32C]BAL23355.1 anti-sigma factor transmembrane transcriptional regulator [Azoarcus sp. KH32C]
MRRPICEDDLHAWADGRLDAARRAEVEAWLAEDPARAERIAAWRRDSERLHAAFDPILDEPIPARLRAVVERKERPPMLRMAAIAAWVIVGTLVGTGLGYRLGREASPPTDPLAVLPRTAAVAHAVYSPEVRHPVEVGADQQQHLVAWLSKRLGAPVHVPDLSGDGFALLGGRLLPDTTGPSAQFMYEDDGGRRLTLYVSIRDDGPDITAFRYAQEGEVGVFYWADGRFAYALSGQFKRETLLPLANAVHHQITP